MSSSRTAGFTVDDVMIRIIPGLLVLFILLLMLSTGKIIGRATLPDLNIENMIFWGIITFLTGELVNLFRESFLPVPSTFRKVIYNETEDLKHLGRFQAWIQKNHSDRAFVGRIGSPTSSVYHWDENRRLVEELLNDQLDLRKIEIDIEDIYKLLLSSLGEDISDQTRRFRRAYIMAENIKYGIPVVVLIPFLIMLISNSISVLEGIGIATVSSLILSLVFFTLKYITYVEEQYVESLIVDYLVKQN